MKRFTSILAVLALTSVANAADTVDMKWNAEMRARYTSDTNYSGEKPAGSNGSNTNYNGIAHRNMLGLHLTKGEGFQGHVSLINNFYWGGSTLRTNSNYNYQTGQAVTTAGNNNNVLLVNEAYGWWKANDMVSVKFGRSSMEIAGGFVYSAYNFQDVPYSFDGVWTDWEFEPVTLKLFGLKLNDTNPMGPGDNDANTTAGNVGGAAVAGNSDPEAVMYGLTVGVKTMPEWLKKAEVHVLQYNDETTNPSATVVTTNNYKTEILRYGLYFGGDMSNFDYRGVADMYSGKFKVFTNNTSTDYNLTGTMFDLGLGYTFAEFMMFRLGASYHMDSGGESATASTASPKDFKSYKPGQYDKHAHGGTYMDAVSWGNLTYWSIDGTIQPMDDLWAKLRYTKFSRTSDKDNVTVFGHSAGGTNTPAAATPATFTSSNDIGTEIDFSLTKKYGDNFSIWALYGVFTPGDLIKQDTANRTGATPNFVNEDQNHQRIQLMGTLTF